MNYNYTLPSIFIGVSIVLIQPQAAQAISCSKEVDTIAEKITVLIDSKAPGSGVIIKREGNTYTVLTAYHVVNQPNLKYEIVTPDNQRYQLKYSTVKPLSEKVDLAVLQFSSSQNYQVAKIGNSDEATRRTNIYITGFPQKTGGIQVPFYDCRDGQVLANATQVSVDGGYTLFYDNVTLPGMSGGPVLSEKGEVIGIHGRSEPAIDVNFDRINPALATVQSGRNAGIPINTFVRLSAKVNLDMRISLSAPKVTTPKADDFFVREQLIKEKLDSVPVFLITNNQRMPLTSSVPAGQNGQKPGAIAQVFMSGQEAQAFMNQLRNRKDQDPKMAEMLKSLQITAVPMGVIYQKLKETANSPKPLLFTFKPGKQEIEGALALINQGGQKVKQLSSVPVFIVKSPDKGYVSVKRKVDNKEIIPLFLSKKDAQALLGQVKSEIPKAEIQVVDIDGIIKTLQDKDDAWLNQVVLVPSPESREYIKILSRNNNPPKSLVAPNQKNSQPRKPRQR